MPSWSGSEQKTQTGGPETTPPAVVRGRKLLAQLFSPRSPGAENPELGPQAEENRDEA